MCVPINRAEPRNFVFLYTISLSIYLNFCPFEETERPAKYSSANVISFRYQYRFFVQLYLSLSAYKVGLYP
ncbi:hypothetical protein LX32DRAFT_348624 [Colletotrichum zoysiae]|uniref:Uncharacterized protein n=1 Tax=Colletotrichum zoysiae TaxID=1216348 RepID=A0AAD9HIE4_9PEZI|nr:hypothetical protein LX32DRAFT_348624 [Colletotrichum zoysiae]